MIVNALPADRTFACERSEFGSPSSACDSNKLNGYWIVVKLGLDADAESSLASDTWCGSVAGSLGRVFDETP